MENEWIIEKKKIRAQIKERLKRLNPEEIAGQSRDASGHLIAHPAFEKARRMLCYCALHKEADPSAIVKQAWAEGKRVAFPWCGENWRMEALEPLKEDAFLVGRHGIIAPDPARSRVIPPEELDLIVVPGLAFDKIGGRLGRGAGYYDRYLSQTAAIFVGFCLENQVVPHVPMDAHDVRLHLIAAPNGVFDTGNRWAARNI